ncbi:MAG: peptidylprolyl isomerase [Acidaminobacteraceae bacterium]
MKLRKSTLSLLILTLVMSIILGGCQAEKSSGSNVKLDESMVASVNGNIITAEAFDKSFALVEKSYNDLYGETIWTTEVEGKTVKQLVKEEILENLILESLIVEFVNDTGFKVEMVDVEESYLKFEEALDQDGEVKEFYAENGLNESFIKQEIEAQLLNQEFKRIVSEEVSLNEEKLNELYDTYTVQVNASHILVDSKELADELKTKIDAGEDFSALASENSKDPGSAVNGGSLGYFPRNVMVPEFEQVAFSSEVGAVSVPVKSQFGYHIIKVDDKLTINDMIKNGSTDSEIELYKSSIVDNMSKEAYELKIMEFKDQAIIVKNEGLLKN